MFFISRQKSAILLSLTILFCCFAEDLRAQRKLKIYVFAGQSNCKGAGSKVADFPFNNGGLLNKDRQSLYMYKVISNVNPQEPGPDGTFPNNPQSIEDWKIRNSDIPHWQFWQRYSAGQLDGDFFGTAAYVFRGAENFDSHIGAEIQFARKMQDFKANNANVSETTDIAIVKVAAGSSSIKMWEPAGRLKGFPRLLASRDGGPHNRYLLFQDHLVPTIKQAINTWTNSDHAAISYPPENVEVAAFIWMQGESDLRHYFSDPVGAAVQYEDSFEEMISTLRSEPQFRNPEMPFLIYLTDGYINRPVNHPDFSGTGGLQVYSERATDLRATQVRLANLHDGYWARSIGSMQVADTVHWDTQSVFSIGIVIFNKLKNTLLDN